MESTIRLFKAVIVSDKIKSDINKETLKKTIPYGFIFSPDINVTSKMIEDAISVFSVNAYLMNSSFHKSWSKIATATQRQLVIEQILHYFTTYVFESDYVYIPNEVLNIPKLNIDKLRLIVIKGLTVSELKDKVLSLLNSGIALSVDTIKDVVEIVKYVKLNSTEVELVKNKEVKIHLYEYLGIVPENPIELLRYIVYKTTGDTLLIKNKETFEKILCNSYKCRSLFSYLEHRNLVELSSIFFRFKPLFIAFRSDNVIKPIINKIRRLANSNHAPMPVDYLNNITVNIDTINNVDLMKSLAQVNIFRKIRLAYALKYRTLDTNSILYRIRNGKGWATEFSFDKKIHAKYILKIVLNSISRDMIALREMKVYIPNYISYSLPVSEKQFVGNIPSGSCITVPNNLIFGVHWFNVDNERVDLDLKIISRNNAYGWDYSYRNTDRSILFSGDMTNAPYPNGATELFYVKKQEDAEYSVMLNNYTSFRSLEEKTVPFNIIIASDSIANINSNYLINPNKVITKIASKIIGQEYQIGLLVTSKKENKFYFTETKFGKSISASNKPYVQQTRDYLTNFYENMISLRDVLVSAGAILVDKKEDADLDLSPEVIDKTTIMNLFV